MSHHTATFPYPGGKGELTEWLTGLFPPHRTYVEPFGGSGSVLYNKHPSSVEVYNDLDSDLVTFFRVLRERPDELATWLSRVPYSREQYEQWATAWWQRDERPADDLERAGRFFFLRYANHSGKAARKAGFKVRARRNPARTFNNARERLDALADRFAEVQIEHRDYQHVLTTYDSPRTLYYLDPPYVGSEDRYANGAGFDHAGLADALADLEAAWVVSYDDPPAPVADLGTVVSRDARRRMSTDSRVREYAVCSFDPADTPTWSPTDDTTQQTLTSLGEAADRGEPAATDGGDSTC